MTGVEAKLGVENSHHWCRQQLSRRWRPQAAAGAEASYSSYVSSFPGRKKRQTSVELYAVECKTNLSPIATLHRLDVSGSLLHLEFQRCRGRCSYHNGVYMYTYVHARALILASEPRVLEYYGG